VALKSNTVTPVPATAEDLVEPPCSQQDKTQWCWAACIRTARSVQVRLSPLQCAVVAAAFPGFAADRIDCCNDPFDDCNRACRANLVPTAFVRNGAAARQVPKSSLTLAWIRTVVGGGGLVAVGWEGPTSNHMVLVVQASPTEDLLVVCDPDRFGSSRMTLAQLKKPDGRWTGWKAKWVWQI
jgi:hypothetical protein